jgi:phospholipid/cholesterol/gamma-HCH transport system permease protein
VDYTGVITTLCTSRGVVVLMCGYVLAAKVGCGLVAEIGSMRIADELDAFESVGLNPMRFVIATRFLAVLLYLPLMYIVAQAAADFGVYLSVVKVVGDISYGTWESVHFGIRDPTDYIRSFVELFAIGSAVAITAMYYGYNVRGGPAEVGEATARAIVLNLILVHAIYAAGKLVFFGLGDPGLSLGG